MGQWYEPLISLPALIVALGVMFVIMAFLFALGAVAYLLETREERYYRSQFARRKDPIPPTTGPIPQRYPGEHENRDLAGWLK